MSEPRIYFAFGSNMDHEQMARRCPGAEALGPGRLDDYRLAFTFDAPSWEGGVATVVPDAGHHVWGVLWALDAGHVAALDRYELVAEGIYRHEDVVVQTEAGPQAAYAYVTLADAPNPPSQAYIDALVRGARHFGIPDEYVAALRSVPTS